MGFDPYNRSLKIQESIETPTPKVGVHLGVWRFISHTLPYFQPPRSMKCDSWASFLAHTFINPCLGNKPKAKVVTLVLANHIHSNVTLIKISSFLYGKVIIFK
jgi:hypothetical protein